MSEFHCLCCSMNFVEEQAANAHPCNSSFMMKNGVISVDISKFTGLKRTRWGRFFDKFWEIDWGWCLAFTGLVVMNAILLPHVHLTLGETILESLALGFAIPRLLK